MTAEIAKPGIDMGIIVRDADASLAFYRDLLGLEYDGENPLPVGGVMHRLRCGTSMVKLAQPNATPGTAATPGDVWAHTGYRYLTIWVANLDEVLAECAAAGHPPVSGPFEPAPGVRIALVEDPDGNRVELAQDSRTNE